MEEKCLKKRIYRGCRMSLGRCQCMREETCFNQFPYRNRRECEAEIQGKIDKCGRDPCRHGFCAQTKMGGRRSWYCECAGSGYYGRQCQTECPKHSTPLPADYPAACALIEDDKPAPEILTFDEDYFQKL